MLLMGSDNYPFLLCFYFEKLTKQPVNFASLLRDFIFRPPYPSENRYKKLTIFFPPQNPVLKHNIVLSSPFWQIFLNSYYRNKRTMAVMIFFAEYSCLNNNEKNHNSHKAICHSADKKFLC